MKEATGVVGCKKLTTFTDIHMDKRTIPSEAIDLDLDNPRTGKKTDQTDALRSLLAIERDGEKVFTLAADICAIGMLDPGDRLYVMESPKSKGRYIALDGNRRVAALRLLNNIVIAEDPEVGLTQLMRQRFKKLRNDPNSKWPEEVDVVVFDSREAAKHFISLRHKGENAGAGRSDWTALQIARFDDSGLWQCLTALRQGGWLDQIVISKIENASFAITTFERISGNALFKSEFGCIINDHSFDPGPQSEISLQGLAWLARDVAVETVSSRGVFQTAEGAHPYIQTLRTSVQATYEAKHPEKKDGAKEQGQSGGGNAGKAGATKDDDHKSDQSSDESNSPETGSSSNPPVTRKKRERKYLADKAQLIYTVGNQKAVALSDELKNHVEVNRAPLASALLVRCFLEVTCATYQHSFNINPHSNKTSMIAATAAHLLSNKPADAPANYQDLIKSFSEHGAEYSELSDIAHNTVSRYSSEHVRATWNNVGGAIDLIWKIIHDRRVADNNKKPASKKVNQQ